MFDTTVDDEVSTVAGGDPDVAPFAEYDTVYVPAATAPNTGWRTVSTESVNTYGLAVPTSAPAPFTHFVKP